MADSQATNLRKKWKWTEEMITALLTALKEHKSLKEFECIDFEADLVVLYNDMRVAMAKKFTLDFGVVEHSTSENFESIKDMTSEDYKRFQAKIESEKVDMKKGYERVKEKIRSLRQDYRTAVNEGTRSGSGRIVRDHWNELTSIWGGCPGTKPLEYGKTTTDNNENSNKPGPTCNEDIDITVNDGCDMDIESQIVDGIEDYGSCSRSLSFKTVNDEADTEDSGKEVLKTKRSHKTLENPTPKFVDNKRKKLEKQLSAKQRDQVLLDAAQKESALEQDLVKGLVESNKNIDEAMMKVADFIGALGAGIVQGFSILAKALAGNTQQPGEPRASSHQQSLARPISQPMDSGMYTHHQSVLGNTSQPMTTGTYSHQQYSYSSNYQHGQFSNVSAFSSPSSSSADFSLSTSLNNSSDGYGWHVTDLN